MQYTEAWNFKIKRVAHGVGYLEIFNTIKYFFDTEPL